VNSEYWSGGAAGSRLSTAVPAARSFHLSTCTEGAQSGYERTVAVTVPAQRPGPAASLSRRRLFETGGALAGLASSLLVSCTPRQGRAPTAQAPATLTPASLSVWVWWKDPVESLQQMAASFTQQHPAVTVSVDAPAGYWDKLQAALAGGVGPDLYFLNNVNDWSWINRDVLVDLTPLVSRDGVMQKHLENAWQDAIAFYKYKGRNYGLPYMYTTVVLYYNVDALRAAGLRPPAEVGEAFDWTLLRDYAQKLTRREGDTVTMWGFQSTEGIETGWLNWVRANGGDFLNREKTRSIRELK
jgi:multiple sugar transport system substrate-binding protein